jgi:hypothetical protein
MCLPICRVVVETRGYRKVSHTNGPRRGPLLRGALANADATCELHEGMARRIGGDVGRYRNRKRLGWAWLLFLIALLFLWVAFNALFMVTGQYDSFTVNMAALSVVSAFLVAWASAKLFQSARHGSRSAHNGVFSMPPMVACLGTLLIFLGFLLVKLL